jgi:hypothetical protein
VTADEATLQQADLVLGSELTYTPISVEGLLRVIALMLAPGGIFLEVLSEDRDVRIMGEPLPCSMTCLIPCQGVPLFVERATALGWRVDIESVPDRFMGRFGTKQV